ncbi:hypothetical protein INT47_006094 [Mucor saturninus]|uniref:Methyltransferase type 11 domain-containing protein n=1 Tax=Mucor saturninus TaxID=64648 RepID=A0A8H7VBE8_9FUNG|nr:hypothetical protein INT47_006094 [Mucor saturninus]
MSNHKISYAGDSYHKFRPSYSQEIYSLIYQFHSQTGGEYTLAIDAGCGTGQSTAALSKQFTKVYGIDTLKDQLDCAITKDNITYKLGPAEDLSDFKDGTVDMVSVATAFHWFQQDIFFSQVKRVLKPNGTLAVFSYYYPVIKDAPEANGVIQDLTEGDFDKYANSNIHYIKNMYREIQFPFDTQKWYISPETADTTHISETINAPLMEASMTIDRFADYMKTSSAYFNYLDDPENAGKEDPVDKMISKLMKFLDVTDTGYITHLEWPTVLVLAKNNTN